MSLVIQDAIINGLLFSDECSQSTIVHRHICKTSETLG